MITYKLFSQMFGLYRLSKQRFPTLGICLKFDFTGIGFIQVLLYNIKSMKVNVGDFGDFCCPHIFYKEYIKNSN
jgi:hypothetical protein